MERSVQYTNVGIQKSDEGKTKIEMEDEPIEGQVQLLYLLKWIVFNPRAWSKVTRQNDIHGIYCYTIYKCTKIKNKTYICNAFW